MTHILALCLAALALLAGGCGDGVSKEDYQNDIEAAGNRLEKEYGDISNIFQGVGNDPNKLAAALEKSARVFDGAATELEDIEPPDDAKDAHEKLTDGAKTLARDFRSAAKEKDDLAALATKVQASDGLQKLNEATEELKDKGYELER
jgi:hypothetical protein